MRQDAADTAKKAREQADGPNQEERRKLRNFFFKPQDQTRYTNWYIMGGFVCMTLSVLFIHYRLQSVDVLLNSTAAVKMGGHIPVYEAFTDITTIALAGFVAYVTYACALAMVISHRVTGPTIAIIACIEAMRKGDYGVTRELRKKDELVAIHDALMDLSRTLKERHGDDAANRADASPKRDAA